MKIVREELNMSYVDNKDTIVLKLLAGEVIYTTE